jgi:DNA-binding FadR family transcriptional regulator
MVVSVTQNELPPAPDADVRHKGWRTSGPLQRNLKQSELVARDIAARIVADDLPEGTRLPNEREMLDEYQVGRSTLREALRLLESHGVLTIRPGREGGPVVRRPRATDLAETLTLLLDFGQVPFSEVYSARQAIEPTLARMAASNIDASTLSEMRESIDRMSNDLPDRAVFRSENFRFHEFIAHAAKSPVLELFTAALESVAGGIAFGAVEADFSTEQRSHVLSFHERLFEALSSGDGEQAEALMREHLAESRSYWIEAYKDVSNRPVRWGAVPRVSVALA